MATRDVPGELRRSLVLARLMDAARSRLRGLLGVVDTCEELVQNHEASEALRDALQVFEDLERALLAVTDTDLSDLAVVLAQQSFELHTLLRSAVASQVFLAREEDVELSCLIHCDVPRRASGDPSLLRQVLVAFVGTAIRHSKGERVLVRISVEQDEGDSFALRFAVADEGGGIAKRIRSGEAASDPGLFHALVAVMGGCVGTDASGELRFVVRLRSASDRDAVESAEEPRPGADPGAVAPHYPILLVSNNPDGVPEVLVSLQRNGYSVELEEDRKRFLARLRERDYGIVLMDADGGSQFATLATRPGGGRLRRVPIVGVPRTGGNGGRLDEPALLRLVERCIGKARRGA